MCVNRSTKQFSYLGSLAYEWFTNWEAQSAGWPVSSVVNQGNNHWAEGDCVRRLARFAPGLLCSCSVPYWSESRIRSMDGYLRKPGTCGGRDGVTIDKLLPLHPHGVVAHGTSWHDHDAKKLGLASVMWSLLLKDAILSPQFLVFYLLHIKEGLIRHMGHSRM